MNILDVRAEIRRLRLEAIRHKHLSSARYHYLRELEQVETEYWRDFYTSNLHALESFLLLREQRYEKCRGIKDPQRRRSIALARIIFPGRYRLPNGEMIDLETDLHEELIRFCAEEVFKDYS